MLVLCADDDRRDRGRIRNALEKEKDSFEVIEAADRASFEKHLECGGFDVVLTDIGLFGLPGAETVRAVKTALPGVPVIVVTGQGSEEIAVQCFREGAADYVIKSPGHIARLSDVVRRVFSGRGDAGGTDCENGKMFRVVVESVLDAVILMDEKGRVQYWNPAAETMFGYSSSEAVGRDVHGLVMPEEFRERFEKGFSGFAKTGRGPAVGRTLTLEARRKSGSGFPAEISLSVLEKEDGMYWAAAIVRDITERKRSEKRIRDSQADAVRRQKELDGLLEAARVLLDRPDFKGAAAAIFKSARRLLNCAAGYVALLSESGDANEVVYLDSGGAPCTVDPNRPMPIWGLREKVWRTGKAVFENDYQESEWKALLPPGHMRLDNVLIAPVMLEQAVAGFIGLANKPGGFDKRDEALAESFSDLAAVALRNAREMEQRKTAEQALKESLDRYETLFNSRNDFIFVHLLEDGRLGKIIEVNQAACRALGYSREEFLEMTPADILGHEMDEYRREKIRELRETGHTVFELHCLAKSGKRIPVEIFSRRVEYDERSCVLSVARDITPRKTAEQALAKSEALLREISRMANVGGFKITIYPSFEVQWTEEIRRFHGGVLDDPHNLEAIYEFVFPEDRDRLREAVQGAMELGEAFDIQVRFLTPKGKRPIWCRLTCGVEMASGKPVRLVGFIQNIDDLKRMEDERIKLEEQLLQSQKLESVGRLAGGIAHDFNNMMSVINGYAELMLTRLKPEDPFYRNAKEILEASQRASGLIRQLLAFSRKQMLAPRIVNMNWLIDNLASMLRRLIGEDIELTLKKAGELPSVKVDPGQMEQVLVNLAINARDAMPKGGRLLIETVVLCLDRQYVHQHRDLVVPGEYVQISVSDNGCGMEKEVLSQVFEPFFTTKERGKGTGLGLSTVYGIVKQSGGYIWCYSEPGRGTTFKIYLPAVREKTQAETDPSGEKPAPSGGAEHILVVEDEESVRKLAEVVISQMGYQVTLAAGGREAVAWVEEKGFVPDLLLTDVVMPDMSGVELAEHLKAVRPDLKVLYMSGYTDNAILHHGVIDPGVSFIQKPFNIGDMAAKIREVLDKKP